MPTRDQRRRLIDLGEVASKFDDAAAAEIWEGLGCGVPMPSPFPQRLRGSVTGYIEEASIPSGGEMAAALRRLHARLYEALSAGDRDAAAAALGQVERPVLERLQRITPMEKLPSTVDLRDPEHGLERALMLLGLLVKGAEFRPGRKRPGGRQSRPTIATSARFTQRRGRPSLDAERWLVHFLAADFRYLGLCPTLRSHVPCKAGPFARLVKAVLDRCGSRGVYHVKLIREYLDDFRKS